MSREYKRSRTRNGTRVQVQLPNSSGEMQPYACEVMLFLELQPKPHAASLGDSSNSSVAAAAAGGQHDNTQAVLLAVLRRFNTVVRTDQPELADMMLEAKVDDFDPQPYVVAVSDIVCALHVCEVNREGVHWLQFPPHQSMSTGYVCELPSTVYNTY